MQYAEKYLPSNICDFRIENNNVYIIDNSNNPSNIYIYSLDSHKVEDYQSINIDEKRYEFYKEYFPDYPYDQIQHVNGNDFYQIIDLDNQEKIFIQYNPINKSTKQYNVKYCVNQLTLTEAVMSNGLKIRVKK